MSLQLIVIDQSDGRESRPPSHRLDPIRVFAITDP